MARKKNKKKKKPMPKERNSVALAARMRKAGPMKSRSQKTAESEILAKSP